MTIGLPSVLTGRNGLAPVSDWHRNIPWTKALPRVKLADRDRIILQLTREKKVLHVGAADAPFTEERLASGELLHVKLREVARAITGIEIDSAAARMVQAKTGVADILIGDFLQDDFVLLQEQTYDVVVCADVLEHVTNPGRCLDRIVEFCTPESIVVISTINALGLRIALRAVFGREAVHPDHVAYYSYSTLAQLLVRHRMKPVAYCTFGYPTGGRMRSLFLNAASRLSPNTADGILMIAAPCTSS